MKSLNLYKIYTASAIEMVWRRRYLILSRVLMRTVSRFDYKFTNGSSFACKRFIDSRRLRRRINHAPGYTITIPARPESRVGVISVQRHNSSHNHIDISIIDDDGLELFRGAVTKQDLEKIFPGEPGQKTAFVRQPTHSKEYALKFGLHKEMRIPDGEYGAGTVKIIYQEPIEIHNSRSGKISFSIYEKTLRGKYALLDNKSHWLCVRGKDPVAEVFGKNNYKSLKSAGSAKEMPGDLKKEIEKIEKDNGRWVLEHKVDGGCEYAKFGRKSNMLWSYRVSKKNGSGICHHDNFEHIRDDVAPGYSGTVVKGELVYVQGKVPDGKFFAPVGKERPNINAKLSNIKNALVSRAARESEGGTTSFVAWDLVKWKGRDVSKWTYERKLEKMEEIAQSHKHFFVPRRYHDADKAWSEIVVNEDREGLVLKRLDKPTPIPESDATKWIKAKSNDFEDVRITGWKPLVTKSGRIDKSRAGILEVDYNGKKVEVGTGFTDFQRRWFAQNFDQLDDESWIRMKYHYVTDNGKVHAPVFAGVHEGKSDGRLLELSLDDSADSLNVSPYQLKSSQGWRRS